MPVDSRAAAVLARAEPEREPEPARKSEPKPEPAAAKRAATDPRAVRGAERQEFARIRADLLDRLVNYAGEVAIYRSRLEQQLGAFRGNLGELDADHDATARAAAQPRHRNRGADHRALPARGRGRRASVSIRSNSTASRPCSSCRARSAESATDLVSLQGVLDDLTRQYETLLLQQSRVSSELQEGLMRTRMVPFDALVPRLRRVLRQAASETGKQVAAEGRRRAAAKWTATCSTA